MEQGLEMKAEMKRKWSSTEQRIEQKHGRQWKMNKATMTSVGREMRGIVSCSIPAVQASGFFYCVCLVAVHSLTSGNNSLALFLGLPVAPYLAKDLNCPVRSPANLCRQPEEIRAPILSPSRAHPSHFFWWFTTSPGLAIIPQQDPHSHLKSYCASSQSSPTFHISPSSP